MRKYNRIYGDKHSVKFQKSVLDDFLTDTTLDDDDHKEVVKVHSDIHLLLRQQSLQRTIGLEQLRMYIDKMISPPAEQHNLSDDELLSMIEPRLDTITDAYEFSQYLQKNHEYIKGKYEHFQNLKKQMKTFEDEEEKK